jgi:hypothetical protein
MPIKIIVGYKKPTGKQVSRLHEGIVICGASLGCNAVKQGRTKVVVDECVGFRGIFATVSPIRRQYPKCRECIAANLIINRLSVQMEPSPLGL